MRFAYYLHTDKGLFVVKKYNQESKKHIEERLEISLHQAAMRDVQTHLVAQHYAKQYNRRCLYGANDAPWKFAF